MRCPRCGAPMDANSTVCYSCGNPLPKNESAIGEKNTEEKSEIMVADVGRKIKTLANIICTIECIGSLILAFALGADDLILFFALIICIPFGAYITRMVLYGFGAMLEAMGDIVFDTSKVVKMLEEKAKAEKNQNKQFEH